MARPKKEHPAQEAEGAPVAEHDEHLVLMTKPGEEDLAVHPTCVDAHMRAGWKVKEA